MGSSLDTSFSSGSQSLRSRSQPSPSAPPGMRASVCLSKAAAPLLARRLAELAPKACWADPLAPVPLCPNDGAPACSVCSCHLCLPG